MVRKKKDEKKKENRQRFYFSDIVLFQELCTDCCGDTSRSLLYKETHEHKANSSFHFTSDFDRSKYKAIAELFVENNLLFSLLLALLRSYLSEKKNPIKYYGFHGSENVVAFLNFYCQKKNLSWSLMKR